VASVATSDTENVLVWARLWGPKGTLVTITAVWVMMGVWAMREPVMVAGMRMAIVICGISPRGLDAMACSHCSNGHIGLSPH